MQICDNCGCKEHRSDVVDSVLRIKDKYVLVKGIPALVCERCGEHNITADDAEAVRVMVHEGAGHDKVVEMQVFNFISQSKRVASRLETAYAGHGS